MCGIRSVAERLLATAVPGEQDVTWLGLVRMDDSTWDTILKAINTAFQQHPFFSVRAGELQRWTANGDYARILAGEYTKRADVKRGDGLGDDIKRGASYYGDQAKAAVDKLGETAKRAKDAFTDAMKGGAR